MIKDKQAAQFLEQLRLEYPAAFKRNFLFYSMIKTKGLMDELKELIPWILSAMIFVSISMCLGSYIENAHPEIGAFRARGLAVLGIMLFFMAVCPFIIKQVKHSSISLYEHLRNVPIKLTLIIILQGLNLAFIESAFLQSLLFFFALSFGFVRFYKENLFRAESGSTQYYYLQETRRACFWFYKQSLKYRFKTVFLSKASAAGNNAKLQLQQMRDMHVQTLHFEHQLCKSFKHIDLDEYLEEMTK